MSSIPHHRTTLNDKTYWLRRWKQELEIEVGRKATLVDHLQKKELRIKRLETKIAKLEEQTKAVATPAQRAVRVDELITAADDYLRK